MKSSKYQQIVARINYFSLLLFVFTFSFQRQLISPIIIIWVLTSLLQVNFRENHFGKLNKIEKLILWNSIFFYLMYVVGLFYSGHISYGLSYLEGIIPIFIFPIIFILNAKLDRQKVINVLWAFVAGVLTSSLFLIIRAIFRYFVSDEISVFYYSDFSYFEHPSYISMYVSFAIAVITNFMYFEKNMYISKKLKFFLRLSMLFLIFIVYLLESKAGFIVLIIVLLLFLLIKMIVGKQWTKKSIIIYSTIAIFILALSILFYSNRRVQGARNVLSSNTEKLDKNKLESNATRIILWRDAINVIKEHFWYGVGTGDVKFHLSKIKNGLFNPHNQYLETFAMLGIFGFLSLIFFFVLAVISALKQRNILLLIFTVIVAINLLPESMLNKQAGVVFIAFFYNFIIFTNIKLKE